MIYQFYILHTSPKSTCNKPIKFIRRHYLTIFRISKPKINKSWQSVVKAEFVSRKCSCWRRVFIFKTSILLFL
jgi:hypothetical protein